jgi:hypothetical protein
MRLQPVFLVVTGSSPVALEPRLLPNDVLTPLTPIRLAPKSYSTPGRECKVSQALLSLQSQECAQTVHFRHKCCKTTVSKRSTQLLC